MRSITIEGYGQISIVPINIKDETALTTDMEGNELTHTIEGRGRSIYKNKEGTEIPSSQTCKKIIVDEEEIITQKLKPTKIVSNEMIEVIDDNKIIYEGIERKFYNVFTDNEKIKDLILQQGKTLKFPLIVGLGFKVWNGILTNWSNKIILVGVRGNINKALEQYKDDVVDFEISLIPQEKNAKKLLKAICY